MFKDTDMSPAPLVPSGFEQQAFVNEKQRGEMMDIEKGSRDTRECEGNKEHREHPDETASLDDDHDDERTTLKHKEEEEDVGRKYFRFVRSRKARIDRGHNLSRYQKKQRKEKGAIKKTGKSNTEREHLAKKSSMKENCIVQLLDVEKDEDTNKHRKALKDNKNAKRYAVIIEDVKHPVEHEDDSLSEEESARQPYMGKGLFNLVDEMFASGVTVADRSRNVVIGKDETSGQIRTVVVTSDKDGDAEAPGEIRARGDAEAPGEIGARGDAEAPGEIRARGDAEAPGEIRARGDAEATGEIRARGDAKAPGETSDQCVAETPVEIRAQGDTEAPGEIRAYGDAETPGEIRVKGDAEASDEISAHCDAEALVESRAQGDANSSWPHHHHISHGTDRDVSLSLTEDLSFSAVAREQSSPVYSRAPFAGRVRDLSLVYNVEGLSFDGNSASLQYLPFSQEEQHRDGPYHTTGSGYGYRTTDRARSDEDWGSWGHISGVKFRSCGRGQTGSDDPKSGNDRTTDSSLDSPTMPTRSGPSSLASSHQGGGDREDDDEEDRRRIFRVEQKALPQDCMDQGETDENANGVDLQAAGDGAIHQRDVQHQPTQDVDSLTIFTVVGSLKSDHVADHVGEDLASELRLFERCTHHLLAPRAREEAAGPGDPPCVVCDAVYPLLAHFRTCPPEETTCRTCLAVVNIIRRHVQQCQAQDSLCMGALCRPPDGAQDDVNMNSLAQSDKLRELFACEWLSYRADWQHPVNDIARSYVERGTKDALLRHIQCLSLPERRDPTGVGGPMKGIILDGKDQMLIENGRYELGDQWMLDVHLANGAVGACFLTFDVTTKKKFCVKRMRRKDFEVNEIEQLIKLEHPYIVEIYGVVHTDVELYIMMEYMSAGRLSGFPLHLYIVLTYMRQILSALAYLAEKDITHEDVKPANICLLSGTFIAKLVDFGVARGPGQHGDVTPLGTPRYWSPEKAQGAHWSNPSDVWAATCVCAQMISDNEPWQRTENCKFALTYRIAENATELPVDGMPSGLPPQVLDFMLQGWHRDPTARRTARELLEHPAILLLDKHGPKDDVFNYEYDSDEEEISGSWRESSGATEVENAQDRIDDSLHTGDVTTVEPSEDVLLSRGRLQPMGLRVNMNMCEEKEEEEEEGEGEEAPVWWAPGGLPDFDTLLVHESDSDAD